MRSLAIDTSIGSPLAADTDRMPDTAAWAARSVAVVIPYLDQWADRSEPPAVPPVEPWQTKPWELTGLWHSKQDGFATTQRGGDADTWFLRERFVTAIAPHRYRHRRLTDDEAGRLALPDGTFKAKVIEDFQFTDPFLDHPRSFLVLHGTVARPAHSLLSLVRRVHRPKGASGVVSEALRLAGVAAAQTTGGFAKATATPAEGGPFEPGMTPVVVSHSVPRTLLPSATDFLDDIAGWTDPETWSWLLATGAFLDSPDFLAPSPTRQAAERGTHWLGGTLMRADRNGISFVSTRGHMGSVDPAAGAEVRNPEHVAMSRMAHLFAPRLVMLSLRQRAFLERHADRLAELEWTGDFSRDAEQALALEQQFVQFRNKLWIRTLPERPAAEALIRILHDVASTGDLMSEIADEIRSVARLLDFDARHRSREEQRARQDAEDERRVAEAGAAAHRRVQQSHQVRLTNLVQILAAVLAPPTIVFSGAALIGEPSAQLFGWATVLSLVIVALTLVVVRTVYDPKGAARS